MPIPYLGTELASTQFERHHNLNHDSTHINNSTSTVNNNSTNNTNNTNPPTNNNRNITNVVPYIQGTEERFKKACQAKEIQVHFKGTNTLKTFLVTPKDKDHKLNKSGVINHSKCPHINCPGEHIGKSGRALGERIKEHLKAPSPIHKYSSSTGHPLSPECFNIIHRETWGTSRNLKEAMFIHVNDPSLNRNLRSTNCHMYGTIFCRTHQGYSSSKPAWSPTRTSLSPKHPLLTYQGGAYILFLGKYSNWRCLQHPQLHLSPLHPLPTLPYTTVPSR